MNTKKGEAFFIPRLPATSSTTITSYNLSSYDFDKEELNVLRKGLSFAPTTKQPIHEQQIKLLTQYDKFATTVRRTYNNLQYTRPQTIQRDTNPPLHAKVYRAFKFLPKQEYATSVDRYLGVHKVEQYKKM